MSSPVLCPIPAVSLIIPFLFLPSSWETLTLLDISSCKNDILISNCEVHGDKCLV